MVQLYCDPSSPLSQWFSCSIEAGAVTFSSAEQYMMYGKAMLFGDEATAQLILATDDPHQQKALGRRVRPFIDLMWRREREEIVRAGTRAKLSQHDELRRFVLDTGDALLAEANPYDKIWGIGLGIKDPRARDPRTWRGQNLLGKILMEIRAELR